jgi:hypothetical protein
VPVCPREVPGLVQQWGPDPAPLRGSFLQELQHCDTDDDVAMCFIKSQEAFEKYLEFLVGRVQAELVVVSTPVQEFYKVTSAWLSGLLVPHCLLPGLEACSWLLSEGPLAQVF